MSKIVANSLTNSNWYKRYDDGWIEQGGEIDVTFSNRGTYSFTFPTPFTEPPLNFNTTVHLAKTGDQLGFELCVTDITATGATLLYDYTTASSNIKKVFWTAKGV